jgi:hypothetical protein
MQRVRISYAKQVDVDVDMGVDLRKQKNPRVRSGMMIKSNLYSASVLVDGLLELADMCELTSASPWPPPPSSNHDSV